MKYIRKPINERVSAAIGIGIFLCAQFSWADTRTLLGEQELDSINAGASAVALAVANGFGGNISGALTGSNTGASSVSKPFAGVSIAGAGAGAAAGGDGGGVAMTSATTGSGNASVGGTMNSNLGAVGPGGIATGASISLSSGITYTPLL